MRIEEVVGKRIKEVRDARGMTQEEFGGRLADLLGKPWPRQAVHVAEKGQRAFTAMELLACSVVLGCEIAYLFRLPAEENELHTPGGVLTRKQITEAERAGIPGAPNARQSTQELFDEIEDTLQKFAPDLRQIASFTENAAERIDIVQRIVSTTRQRIALEERYGELGGKEE